MNSITTRLLTARVAGDPVLDAALSSALLQGVVAGAPPVARLSAPEPMVSFGRLDRLAGGFPVALAVARGRGFTPVLRVGGGRAHAVHEGVVEVGIAAPAHESTTERFVAMADGLRRVLTALGAPPEIGALPREFCPGAWSLHAGGIKLAGIAQRVTRGAAWTEAFLMVSGGARSRAVLTEVYAALGMPLDPATVGALEDLVPGVSWDDAAAALRDALGPVAESVPAAAELALARELRSRHEP